jgi:hypothetical protein
MMPKRYATGITKSPLPFGGGFLELVACDRSLPIDGRGEISSIPNSLLTMTKLKLKT